LLPNLSFSLTKEFLEFSFNGIQNEHDPVSKSILKSYVNGFGERERVP